MLKARQPFAQSRGGCKVKGNLPETEFAPSHLGMAYGESQELFYVTSVI